MKQHWLLSGAVLEKLDLPLFPTLLWQYSGNFPLSEGHSILSLMEMKVSIRCIYLLFFCDPWFLFCILL